MRRLHRQLHDESGMSYVFVGMGMLAFLSASMLAIDVGMLMTARNQAQNSADAGALAGATALYFNDFDDRSATGPAVTSAISASEANAVMAGTVSVKPEDVEFLNDELGEPTRVRVTVYRTAARGNPLSLLVARVLYEATDKRMGQENSGVYAVATAEASPANAMTCVKPFTIPDRWREVGEPIPDGEYRAYTKKGDPLPVSEADVYIPALDENGNPNPDYTGYNNAANRGEELVLRASHGNEITQSFYYSLAMTDDTGGQDYRWNIANCNTSIYKWGDPLIQEPGAMEGPTIQGIEALIAKDPGARWDDATDTVVGSSYGPDGGKTPRIFPIPLYDPEYYDSGKRTGRTASLRTANWIGFFVDRVVGSQIYGRIIPIAGIRDKSGPKGSAAFPKAIRLVQ